MRNDTLSIILVVLSIVLLICCTIVQNITQNTINKQKGTIATMQEIIDILEESR